MHYIMRDDVAILEKRYVDTRSSVEIVQRFVDLFQGPEFLGVAVVLNGPNLSNRRFFEKEVGLTRDTPYLRLTPECFSDWKVREEVVEACTHRGDMSVFFFPREPALLWRVFQYFHHFDHIDREEDVDQLAEVEHMPRVEGEHLARFLAENTDSTLNVAYAFSHDADFLYEIKF